MKAFPADRKKIDVGDYYSDGRCIEQTLDWKPVTDLEAALHKTCAWFHKELRHCV